MKRLLIVWMFLSSCAKLSVEPTLALDHNGNWMAQKNGFLYTVVDSHLVSNRIEGISGLWSGRKSSMVLANGEIFLIENQSSLRLSLLDRGTAIAESDSNWYVATESGLILFRSGERAKKLENLRSVESVWVWQNRFFVLQNGEECLILRYDADFKTNGLIRSIKAIAGGGDEPYVYLVDLKNRIFSYNLYSGETNVLADLPFTVKRLKFDTGKTLIIAIGTNHLAIIDIRDLRISMGSMEIWDAELDSRKSLLYILDDSGVQVLDYQTKSNLIHYRF